MLSDEEKYAIDYLKIYIERDVMYENRHYKQIEIILNLIKKQSKEIEELKNEVMEKELIIDGMKEDRRIAVEEIQEQYYVSKDKIKTMLENEIINISGFECVAKEDVQSLLEKE